MPDNEDWQILAEEAAQEKDPKKLMEIISALTVALNKQNPNPSMPNASAEK